MAVDLSVPVKATGHSKRFRCPPRCLDNTVLTDLTIGGIIDHWNPDG